MCFERLRETHRMRPRGVVLGVVALSIALSGERAPADGNSPTMVVFGRDGNGSPAYSTFDDGSWSSPLAMPSVGAETYWVVLKNCPTRDETACATLDQDNDINVLIYDGSAWGGATEVCSDAATNSTRPFDLCYEQESGDMLLAYWDNGDEKVGFRTYGGTVLSGEGLLTMPSTADLRFVSLTPNPATDEILLLAGNDENHVFAAAWNGGGWGSVTTLVADGETATEEQFAVTYESQSGAALVVYTEQDDDSPHYRVWDGTSWSADAQMPSIGAGGRWLRLAADPASDEILFAAVDDSDDINVNVWNGSSWGSTLQVESDAFSHAERRFDLAYEAGGGKALLVYHQAWMVNPRYRTWDGSSWSSEQQGPLIWSWDRVIQLRTGTTAGEVFVAESDFAGDLQMLRWDGSSLSGPQELHTDLGGTESTERFMLALPSGLAPTKLVLKDWSRGGANERRESIQGERESAGWTQPVKDLNHLLQLPPG